MPAAQLFVDGDDENDDIEDGDSGDDNSVNGGDDVEEERVTSTNGELKAKKRKGNSIRGEEKRNKKLKKLGPKQEKGSKRAEKLTKKEIKELTEKEYTQYSNLYDVQLEEVLKECTISEGKRIKVQEWLEEFTTFIQDVKPTKRFRVEKYSKYLKSVQLPLPKHIFTDGTTYELLDWMMKDQKLKWEPPVSVQIRGSWALDTALENMSCVDVFLEMPQEYLVKSDTLNHKYHVKRAIYLGYVARMLQERGEDIHLNFTLANGDPLKPVISVEVVDGITVLIRAVPPQGFFRTSKLTCDKNNLRYGHFFKKEKSDDDPDTSTQHYNFTILEDVLAVEINQEMFHFLSGRVKFQDAVKLIKIWLAQRGLLQGYGGFSGFIVAQFINYLFHTRKIQENMSTLQIIIIFLVNLVQMDLSEKGIGFCDQSDSVKYAQYQWDVVFLDRTGILNFTANLSKLTFRRIQEEARLALTIIDKRNVTGFMALFMTRVKFFMNFDHCIKLAPNRLDKALREKPEYESTILDYSGFIYPVAASTVGSLIKTCLGNRITMLDCQLPETDLWSITQPIPHIIPDYIQFGLNINRDASQKLVEKCDSDNLADIDLFKKFWGEKSELRRFKDGTLRECVPLENISHFGKSRLCYQMLHYIFQKHLKYTMGENVYIDEHLENLMEPRYVMVKPGKELVTGPNGRPIKKAKNQPKIYMKGKLAKKKTKKIATTVGVIPEEKITVSVDQITRNVSDSFDELSKILRQLEELPLQISTVQGTSAVLRFCHVQPTPPQNFFINTQLTEQDRRRKTLLLKRCGDPPKKNSVATTNGVADDGEDDDDDEIKLLEEVATSSSATLPKKLPKYVEPIGVIIHLETSGKWPDNMQAIERLKCAFLIKIGELLLSKFGFTVQPYAKHLDVLKDGFVFRIKITYFRELTLLRELRGSDGILRARDNAESLRLEKEALILPQLTSTLHSFHLQYEAYGKTCRLAKRWVASQLLLASPVEYNRNLEEPDCRMTEECVELMVAYLFLNSAPYLSFPSEAQVGFQRFLYLLAKTDFTAVPIIVNFHDKWTADEVAAIELEFVKLRPTLPSIFIATPFDPKGSVWTKNVMSVLLKRIKRLAEVALCVLENHFLGQRVVNDNSTLKLIFTPITRDLDVIIRLKSKMNPRSSQIIGNIGKSVAFKEYKKKKVDEVIPIVDFDPVQMYLQELRDGFGHLAVFMHDTFGGEIIAVKWKPEVFKGVKFTTAAVKGRCVSHEEPNSLTTNINGVLEAFEIMGNGIVENIELFPEKWEI